MLAPISVFHAHRHSLIPSLVELLIHLHLCWSLVQIISLEQRLHARGQQAGSLLFDRFRVFEILIHVLLVEVGRLDIWDERRLHDTALKQIPVEAAEPLVSLRLLAAQPRRGIVQHTFVDEVERLRAPAFDLVFLSQLVLVLHLLPDLICFSAVGLATHHALVRDHSNRKVV